MKKYSAKGMVAQDKLGAYKYPHAVQIPNEKKISYKNRFSKVVSRTANAASAASAVFSILFPHGLATFYQNFQGGGISLF